MHEINTNQNQISTKLICVCHMFDEIEYRTVQHCIPTTAEATKWTLNKLVSWNFKIHSPNRIRLFKYNHCTLMRLFYVVFFPRCWPFELKIHQRDWRKREKNMEIFFVVSNTDWIGWREKIILKCDCLKFVRE